MQRFCNGPDRVVLRFQVIAPRLLRIAQVLASIVHRVGIVRGPEQVSRLKVLDDSLVPLIQQPFSLGCFGFFANVELM